MDAPSPSGPTPGPYEGGANVAKGPFEGDYSSFELRHPTLSRKELWLLARKTYIITSRPISLALYKKGTKQQLLGRHDCNDRGSVDTLAKLKEGIKLRGTVDGGRNECYAVPTINMEQAVGVLSAVSESNGDSEPLEIPCTFLG